MSEILFDGLIKFENNIYFCQKCNKGFKSKNQCINHVSTRKTDCSIKIKKVLYKCDVCGKEYSDKTKYKVHMNSKKCKQIRENLSNYNKFKEIVNLFVDNFFSDFWINVFLLKGDENNYCENLNKFLFELNENKIQDIYSKLIKLNKKIGEERICQFISNINKNIEKCLNKKRSSEIFKWNKKLNEEVIKLINFD